VNIDEARSYDETTRVKHVVGFAAQFSRDSDLDYTPILEQ
jgi:hypothetical protein